MTSNQVQRKPCNTISVMPQCRTAHECGADSHDSHYPSNHGPSALHAASRHDGGKRNLHITSKAVSPISFNANPPRAAIPGKSNYPGSLLGQWVSNWTCNIWFGAFLLCAHWASMIGHVTYGLDGTGDQSPYTPTPTVVSPLSSMPLRSRPTQPFTEETEEDRGEKSSGRGHRMHKVGQKRRAPEGQTSHRPSLDFRRPQLLQTPTDGWLDRSVHHGHAGVARKANIC